MKILYKPFEIIAGIIGGKIADNLFNTIWARFDHQDPPRALTAEASFPKVIGAAALEAATVAAVSAAVDRAGARAFQHLTGIWPGEHQETAE
jgi:Protein of unknown function (DUF4235)